MSSRRRTCKAPKGYGYEYGSPRPGNKAGVAPAPGAKRRTHKAERRQGKKEANQ